MNQKQTEQLYEKGKEAWNKWAEELLANKNEDDQEWQQKARAIFNRQKLTGKKTSFRGFIFPGRTEFKGTIFSGKADFQFATFFSEVHFSGAEFLEDTCFNDCRFHSHALFSHFKPGEFFNSSKFYSTFEKRAFFNRCIFEEEAWFSHVIFKSDVQFIDSYFKEWARFDDIECHTSIQFEYSTFENRTRPSPHGKPHERGVWFVNASFAGQAWFRGTHFFDDVTFQGTVFENDAIFLYSNYYQKASFIGVNSNRMFDLSGSDFTTTPNFIQTHFTESPIFDDVNIATLNNFGFLEKFLKKNKNGKKPLTDELATGQFDEPAKWRALRRLAVQGHDHEKERDFFSGEIWSAPISSYKFWFGYVYYLFSNHGRSVLRPVLFYVLLTLSCFLFYMSQSPCFNGISYLDYAESCLRERHLPVIGCATDKKGCAKGATNASQEAVNLALRRSLIDIEKFSGSNNITLSCLYGTKEMEITESIKKQIPNTPRIVSYVMVIQKLFAGLFIFLFGFAIRNMLRVK